jgi:hypothetical protein
LNEKEVQSWKKLNSVDEENFPFKKMLENSKFSKMLWYAEIGQYHPGTFPSFFSS